MVPTPWNRAARILPVGNRLEFAGPIAREHGTLPTRITNRADNASELIIQGSDLTGNEIAGIITRAEKLETLQVTGHPLENVTLRAIASKDRLQTFTWENAATVTDADAVYFQELSHLRVFRLGHADLTSAFAASFADRRHIWQFALHDGLVDDTITATLAKLSELRVVSLARSFVTGATLGDLATTQCAELHLDGCDLNGPGLGEALTRLSGLKVLSLDDSPVGDELAHFLIGRPHLTTLSLRNTKITDQALVFFEFLPKKIKLLVHGTPTTAAGIAKLKAKRPDLLIES